MLISLKNRMGLAAVLRAPEGGTPSGTGTSAPEVSSASPSSASPSSGDTSASPSLPSSGANGADSPSEISSPRESGESAFNFPEVDDLDGYVEEIPVKKEEAEIKPPEVKPPEPVKEPVAAKPEVTPPAADQAGPTDERPPLDLSNPVALAEAMSQNMEELITHLTNDFQLSEAEKEALETDAVAAFPRLGAVIYAKSQVNFLKQLGNLVPRMIDSHLKVTKARDTREGSFYDKWKEAGITREAHGPLVDRLGRLYRQQNPNASFDQMVEELGPVIMMTAKLTGQPTAPVVGANGATVPARPAGPPPSPFKPVGPSSPAGAVATSDNPWAGMAGDYD